MDKLISELLSLPERARKGDYAPNLSRGGRLRGERLRKVPHEIGSSFFRFPTRVFSVPDTFAFRFRTPYSPFWRAFGLAVQGVGVVGGGAISVMKVMSTRPTWDRAAEEFTPLNVNSTTPEPVSPL